MPGTAEGFNEVVSAKLILAKELVGVPMPMMAACAAPLIAKTIAATAQIVINFFILLPPKI
jgi:hypothetical protein